VRNPLFSEDVVSGSEPPLPWRELLGFVGVIVSVARSSNVGMDFERGQIVIAEVALSVMALSLPYIVMGFCSSYWQACDAPTHVICSNRRIFVELPPCSVGERSA
jgi:hypothetical protein